MIQPAPQMLARRPILTLNPNPNPDSAPLSDPPPSSQLPPSPASPRPTLLLCQVPLLLAPGSSHLPSLRIIRATKHLCLGGSSAPEQGLDYLGPIPHSEALARWCPGLWLASRMQCGLGPLL